MHIFKPVSTKKPQNKRFLAIDTETESTGEFICGAIYGVILSDNQKQTTISQYFDNQEAFITGIEEILSKNRKYKSVIVGHNIDYDLIYLGGLIDTSSKLYGGSRLISAKTITGHKIMDTGNFVDGSLSDWMKRLNMEEYKIDGYLQSEAGKRAQVLNDAKATYKLAEWVARFFLEKFGVSIRSTKFSTALSIFQSHYFKGFFYRKDSEEWKNDYERRGYYGGRVEAFIRGEQTISGYDINGMYVDIMAREKIPNPSKTRYLKNSDEIKAIFENDGMMMIDVSVNVPEMHIGVLPYRDQGKLIFPIGQWRGVYSSIELKTAIYYGAEITEYHSALFYPESDYYFSDYAKMTQEGRKEAKKSGDKAIDQLYKYLGNGLYGKFGQRNSEGGQYIELSQFKGDLEGKTIIPNPDGHNYVEIPKSEQKDALHTFPIICAWITSIARVKLLHALKANSDIVAYCDTDSIKLIDDRPKGITISSNTGDWGAEGTETVTIFRPKWYGSKSKGVPKRAQRLSHIYSSTYPKWIGWMSDYDSESFVFEQPTKFKTAIRHGKIQNNWIPTVKVLCKADDKREWVGNTSTPKRIYVCENNIELCQTMKNSIC